MCTGSAINDNPIKANWARALVLAPIKLITNSRINSYSRQRETQVSRTP